MAKCFLLRNLCVLQHLVKDVTNWNGLKGFYLYF